jgi:hypothetical protein
MFDQPFITEEQRMVSDLYRNFVNKEIMPVRHLIDDVKDHTLIKKSCIVKDVKHSADLFRFVFNAEVYDSSDKKFSVAYEKLFPIGGTWIAIMEGNSSSDVSKCAQTVLIRIVPSNRFSGKRFVSRPL